MSYGPGIPPRTKLLALAAAVAIVAVVVPLSGCLHPTPAGGVTTGGGGTNGNGGSGAAAHDGGPGGSTDGGGAEVSPPRGPTPARTGHNFPFPQNRMSAGCTYPVGYLNDDVQAAYAQWKSDTVTSDGANGHLRVRRPNDHDTGQKVDSTVSEGIGYGMIIAVFMDDQTTFDELWKYEQGFLDDNGLMHWNIAADGTTILGMNGATDADEDMAFALLMADKQWGGQGTQSKPYIQIATDQIRNVWVHEIYQSTLLLPGDAFGNGFSYINISYFAPAYYRLFKNVDIAIPMPPNWDAVVNTSYDTITIALNNDPTHQQMNGLVPAWCSANGMPPSGVCSPAPQPSGANSNYQYDSCRTPFRIALDWCWNQEPRAQAYLAKTSAFFSGIGAKQIVDGYGLDGTPQPQFAMGGSQSAAFVGPAAVGAMSDPMYQTFVNQAYADVATRQLLVGGTYYDDSWTVMSMLMLTGNFLNYTAY